MVWRLCRNKFLLKFLCEILFAIVGGSTYLSNTDLPKTPLELLATDTALDGPVANQKTQETHR